MRIRNQNNGDMTIPFLRCFDYGTYGTDQPMQVMIGQSLPVTRIPMKLAAIAKMIRSSSCALRITEVLLVNYILQYIVSISNM